MSNPFQSNVPQPRGKTWGTTHFKRTGGSYQEQEPIWAARHVEWPIPSQLSAAHYNRLVKAGNKLGTQAKVQSSDVSSVSDDGKGSTFASTFKGLLSPSNAESGASTVKSSDSPQAIDPPRIGCVAASNGWIVAAFDVGSLRVVSRWNVRRSGVADPLQPLPPGTAPLARVLVDPTAAHTLVTTVSGDAYYAHDKLSFTALPGFGASKDGCSITGIAATAVAHLRDDASQASVQVGLTPGSYVTTVAWDKEKGTEGSTKSILLGTSMGEIYEYSMAAPNSKESNHSPPHLLHKLGSSDDAGPVTGLVFERLRVGILVLITTSGRHKRTRFYSFYSAHSSSFRMVMADSQSQQVELPGSVDSAKLIVSKEQFAVNTATGIYYGRWDPSTSQRSSSRIVESGILPYDKVPISLALTPHHFATLSDQQEVCFINRVSRKSVQRERVDLASEGSGEFLMDVRRPDQVWLRKGRSLVHISTSQEDRDVWKYSLQKCLEGTKDIQTLQNMFESTKALCSVLSQKSVVTAIQAEYHLREGHYELAAQLFASCPLKLKPFPDTALRLASVGDDYTPLVMYLDNKMRSSQAQRDRIVCTMIGAWLTELLLSTNRSQLKVFLDSNLEHMEAKLVLEILTSHDIGAEECAAFAEKSGDLGTAVNAALSIGSPDASAFSALEILNLSSFEAAENLYYKHALLFLSKVPEHAGESFLSKYSQGLNPTRLLPSLMSYERLRVEKSRMQLATTKSGNGGSNESESLDILQVGQNASLDGFELKIDKGEIDSDSFVDDPHVLLQYLEGVINQGCKASAVHSYLVSLYIKLEDEEPLLTFLTKHVKDRSGFLEEMKGPSGLSSTGDLGVAGPLDLSFALRSVLNSGRHYRSAIKLYMGFGMRQEAVELALKVDPAHAQSIAKNSVDIDERKRLWLMIAKNAANGSVEDGREVVSRVVAVLRDCGPDVLSIEDVLPFLPDFTRIDEIKDEISDALTSYSTKIDSLFQEMSSNDKMCDAFRQDIGRLRNRKMRMRSDARCSLSQRAIVDAGESYYVFPSGYAFLKGPLKDFVFPFLNKAQQSRTIALETQLDAAPKNDATRRLIQHELDGLIAAECPLTGSVMVDSVGKGFDEANDLDLLRAHETTSPERVDV